MISENALRSVFEGSLKLKPSETFLVVTDTVKEDIGRAFYEYACGITQQAKIVVMDPTREHGTEPPAHIAEEMLKFDVQLLITDKSLTHTLARREATKTGARIATMPSITEDIANRCLDIDYDDLKVESNKVYDIFRKASTIKVTTDLGTDITMKVGKSTFFGANGGSFDTPGSYGNLPEGEISFGPEKCDGTFIVDASLPGFGILDSPITFSVSDSIVRDITGKRSEELRQRLDHVGPKAYRIAEFGIGLNPHARIIGNILEDEKVIGTIHIALGNNLTYGGDNDVPLHIDGVMTNPDVYVDGKKIMDNGCFIR